jgi:F-type H+-transporting ATPase subunit epsilon
VKTFTLKLYDPTHCEQIADVTSFVGEDPSGSFGILAAHSRMITVLNFGLARYKTLDTSWRFIAMPGGTLYFDRNLLRINTQRFILCNGYRDVEQALHDTLANEQDTLKTLTTSVRNVEEHLLNRLSKLDNPIESSLP